LLRPGSVTIEQRSKATDLWAIQQGYVSLMPLRLDLTDEDERARVERN